LRKLVSIKNSRDFETYNPSGDTIDELSDKFSWDTVLARSIDAWDKIWKKADLEISGDRYSQMLLRLHIYHLYTVASPHHKDLDFGIPARGLHGEAYRGHIFWDELYALPFYTGNHSEISKSVLMYRYRRIDQARKYAEEHGYEGIMFPWQSGSDGREESQVVHLNPVSGEWGPDYSSLQRHISLAVAYNIWQYYQITGDLDFINSYGAEMFFGICRFWASKCKKDEKSERYSIHKVMGPDEFHEKLPEAVEGGLTDNAYTNLMVVWCMKRAFDIMDQLSLEERKRVVDKIVLKKEELVKWKEITKKMKVNINDRGIIEQFEGYFGLKELNWDEYREKYDDIHRMDRILKAEGKSPDDYKVAKQADVLMTYYNIDPSDVHAMLKGLGYNEKVKKEMLKRNFDYYIERTSHGSTLSRVVHAYLAKMIGKHELAWDLYLDALASDYVDIQGGTTSEGIHMGVMGGTVLSAMTVFAGLNWHGEALRLDPDLPRGWNTIKFSFRFKGGEYFFTIGNKKVRVSYKSDNNEEVRIFIRGMKFELSNEKIVETEL
ncbi:MAG: glycosyl hydrolase family 65 protein, partial [Bacteroidota bacterium]